MLDINPLVPSDKFLQSVMDLHKAWKSVCDDRVMRDGRQRAIAAKLERDALRRFYDDFWSHAIGTDGDADYWAIPKNELEVAEEAVKAIDATMDVRS